MLEGAPARSTLEITVPANLRRSRHADLGSARIELLAALGVGETNGGSAGGGSARCG